MVLVVKNLPANAGDVRDSGWIPGSGRSSGHPVSCIEPGLVICFTYDNIHVSMLFSQIIPPSPSPTETNSLFFAENGLSLVSMHGLFMVMASHCRGSFFIAEHGLQGLSFSSCGTMECYSSIKRIHLNQF